MPVDLDTLFPKLVNLLLDPVVVVDAASRILFISEACEQLLGYTQQELVGECLTDLVHPDDASRTHASIVRVMNGQPHLDFENRYVRKDGGIVHIQWSARWSEEDQVRIGVARDVTELRRASLVRDAVYRISQAGHSSGSLQALCQEIHCVIGELLSTDDLYVAFYDEAQHSLSYPFFTHEPLPQESLLGGTAIAEVLSTGQVLLAMRDDKRPGHGKVAMPLSTEANWLGVPLVSEGRVWGVVVIESRSHSEYYTEANRDLLHFVATQIAMVIERKQAEENLRFMAHHDSLTGLTNRSLFYDRLETALRYARREDEQVGLLYLDLNTFKQVNDCFGHEAGDHLLCEVARRLERSTRESDTVARMGGDEFTILLTSISDSTSVDVVAQKIREVMAEPFEFNTTPLSLSFSIGKAIYPIDGHDATTLLRHADAGMYGMKRKLGERK